MSNRDLEFILTFKNEARKATKQAKGDFSSLGKEVGKTTKKTKGFNTSVTKASKGLTKAKVALAAFTAALSLAFLQGTKDAISLQREMSKIELLTIATKKETQLYKEELSSIAGETGKGLNELAQGLFVINSAGLTGATALRSLTSASKASALGLGEVNDLARLSSAAVFKYGEENLTASKALSVVVKTAEQGNFEISELSASMGRVIPVAKTLGVSFADTGAGIAVITKTGVPAAQAVDSLRAIFSKLLVPAEEGLKVLKASGTSVEDIRANIQDNGLLGALIQLQTALKGNTTSWKKLLGDELAVQGVMNLLDKDTLPSVIDTFTELGTTLEDEISARFSEFSETEASQLDKSMAEIRATFAEFGEVVLPIVSAALSSLRFVVVGIHNAFISLGNFLGVDFAQVNKDVVAGARILWRSFSNSVILAFDTVTLSVLGLKALFNDGILSEADLAKNTTALERFSRNAKKSLSDIKLDLQAEDVQALLATTELSLQEAIIQVTTGTKVKPIALISLEEEKARLDEIGKALKEKLSGFAKDAPGFTTGGGGSEAQIAILTARKEQIQAIYDETEATRLLISGQETSADIAALRIELAKAATEQERELIQQQIQAIQTQERANVVYEEYTAKIDRAKQFTDDLADSIGDTFKSAVLDIDNAGDAVGNLINKFIDLALEIAVIEPLTQSLRNVMGSIGTGSTGSSSGGSSSTLFDFAAKAITGYIFKDGAAFNKGRVTAFADGGVVNSPTLFPMSGGTTGLMGEAGPEAILPLTRLPGGELGVTSVPSSGMTGGTPPLVINQTINISTGVQQTVQAEIRSLMPEIKRQTQSAVEEARMRGITR